MIRWLLILVAGCSFNPTTTPPDDGAVDDTPRDGTDDAAPDAPVDALPACPAPPSGCTLFSCAGSTSCYYECARVSSYTEARDGCSSRALGCLTTIDSVEENACIAQQVAPVFNSKLMYFGFRQDAAAAEPAEGWGWECGTTGYTAGNWGDFEPNNAGNEDCGLMIQDGAWIDGICGASAVYVCELPR
jgi:hypothetical protein